VGDPVLPYDTLDDVGGAVVALCAAVIAVPGPLPIDDEALLEEELGVAARGLGADAAAAAALPEEEIDELSKGLSSKASSSPRLTTSADRFRPREGSHDLPDVVGLDEVGAGALPRFLNIEPKRLFDCSLTVQPSGVKTPSEPGVHVTDTVCAAISLLYPTLSPATT